MGYTFKDKNGTDLGRPMSFAASDAQVYAQLNKLALEGKIAGLTSLERFMLNCVIDYEYCEDADAYYTMIRVFKNCPDGRTQTPIVCAPNDANPGTDNAYTLAVREGLHLVINAGLFFNEPARDGDKYKCPDGMLLVNGVGINPSPTIADHEECEPLVIKSDGTLTYADWDCTYQDILDMGGRYAVTGFGCLIEDYEEHTPPKPNRHITENCQRQVICQFSNGDYGIFTSCGRNADHGDGFTYEELMPILYKYNVKFAYNLDGGGSTETMLGKKHMNYIYEGSHGRICPTYIAF